MKDELLTIEEVARMLKVSERHVFRLMERGELSVVKNGRKFTRILRSDLENYINRHRTESPQDIED